MSRPLYQIADDIEDAWEKVHYAAKPYLQAMKCLDDINSCYGLDPAKQIVAYFLSNASSFRGPKAKKLKDELKALLKG